MSSKEAHENSKIFKSNEAFLERHKEITKKRSITPDTHKINEVQISEDFSIYKDKYEYKGNSVIHFGINSYEKILEEEGQQFIDSDVKSQSAYSDKNINGIKHHSLEINLMIKAVDYFIKSSDKTILIDIFERHVGKDNNGAIKQTKDDKLKTHTVVLYKVSNDVMLIIDPSNYYFSSHLVNLSSESEELKKFKFILPNQKAYKIYSPFDNAKTGSALDEWRDCVDIAVKLAFGFNKLGVEENILQDKTVISISNNKDIDNNIFYKTSSIRKKQSSDIDIIKKFNVSLQKYNIELKEQKTNEFLKYDEQRKVLENQYNSTIMDLENSYIDKINISGGDSEIFDNF